MHAEGTHHVVVRLSIVHRYQNVFYRVSGLYEMFLHYTYLQETRYRTLCVP
jgi:hypothetical protein